MLSKVYTRSVILSGSFLPTATSILDTKIKNMPKKVSDKIIELFAQVSAGLKGCWADDVRIDRVVIESNTCPHCWKPLQYKGFSNAVEYWAFGICEPCEFAKQFWSEGAELTKAKKRICRGAKKRKTEAATV